MILTGLLMTPRHQTQTERDLEGIAAKKKRETEPQGHAIVDLTPVPETSAMVPRPDVPVVPRHEFDFEQRTPPAMDPHTYHALQTMRAEVLNVVTPILSMVEARDIREAAERAAVRAAQEAKDKLAAEERERRRKYIVPIITAVGIALAGIIAALVHGCAS